MTERETQLERALAQADAEMQRLRVALTQAEAARENAEARERAAGTDMVAVVNAAAAYLGAMTWSPSQDPKWKPGDGIIDYKTPEERLKKLIKGPSRPGAALLAELTLLRELADDLARWREAGGDIRDLRYVLETMDRYAAMKEAKP